MLSLIILLTFTYAFAFAQASARNSLIEKQSVTYEFLVSIEADDPELVSYFEDITAAGFVESISLEETVADSKDDIEWFKVTVVDNSPTDVILRPELKLRGQGALAAELPDTGLPFFIQTIGIGKGYVLEIPFEEGTDSTIPSELEFQKVVDLEIGGSTIEAYEFFASMTSEGVESSLLVHYEKNTGILLGFIGTFEGEAPDVGHLRAETGLGPLEIVIPTTLSMSFAGEISEDDELVVTGKVTPAVSEGQVLLTYQKDDSAEQPITRQVAVTDGSFSDSFRLGSGSYTVLAEYPASGAYLSSTSDKKILSVTPGETALLVYAIIGVVIFFGIIAAIVIGIFLAIKKRRNRKRQAVTSQEANVTTHAEHSPPSTNILTRTYDKPADQVFRAVLEAASDARLSLKTADQQKNHIELSKGMSGWSWGESLEIDIAQSNGQSIVYFNSRRKVATNIASNPSSPVLDLAIAIDKKLG